ncbi:MULTISPECIES: c-type cytochrome [unclassified Pseudomonas]|jgi:mono/diheme cytochrome c family protein|uniref:c-type cytochrome n=1 Tax=unclassified Pseudomonas TaxID=196821 RepID=UPI0009E7589B|nr:MULTISPECIES: cytochrome c [unclassified Pseudomonas]WPN49686.1 cytochrome c [Pseudomonas sp. P8_241]
MTISPLAICRPRRSVLRFSPLLLTLATATLPAHAERSAQQVWADTCTYCHSNGIGPELRGRQLPPAMIQAFARFGVRQMPAFRDSEISDSELATLANWISQQPATTAEEKPHVAP